jgi:hypothetical protein
MSAKPQSRMTPHTRAMAIIERSRVFDDTQPQHKWPVDWATRPRESVDLRKLGVEIERHLRDALKQEREACAMIADNQAQEFLSPRYATGQPASTMAERFACKTIADAIRHRDEIAS